MSNPLETNEGKPSLGTLQELQDNWGREEISGSLQVAKTSITASGTAGVGVEIPVGAEIVDMVVHAKATVGGGTARLRVGGGGANISDAVTMATDGNVTRCASLVQASKIVGANGVEIVTAADTNLGDVYLLYKK